MLCLKKLNIAVVTLVVIVNYIGYVWIDKYQSKVESLEAENQELLNENQRLEAAESYSELPTPKETKGYKNWSKYVNISAEMEKDSDGNFKQSWGIFLVKEAAKYQIDPFIAYELLKVETGATFDPDLIGPKTKYGQAYGMAQFMRNTAPWIADMANMPYKDELLFDPYYSMKLSLVYLDFLKERYGNWNEALTAYHRGMGGMKQYKEKNGHAKSKYATRIQRNAEKYQSVATIN
ncbi:transglycosylase SLT domain-containing protein [Aquibacillus kalidii]|uniref:transglycosylase SLT domain-containing protein n=1 Tax=Aquibacillus kalidii TaxID=2762597 RepID=UPI001647E47C|nr:transglycosylase SLT domain-containing protein [Aquibacillus kalidii]